ncbi:MAG: chromosomal replication initiator protein DnaA, partial [Anaerolineae bacterium]
PYARQWLQHRLLGAIKRTLAGITGRTVEVRFVVRAPVAPSTMEEGPLLAGAESPEDRRAETGSAPGLHAAYTFERFVVGDANRLAHAAFRAVAEQSGPTYNPLLVCGDVGLGKTHLLHALGHLLHAHGQRILYVPAETFTNDLVEAIRRRRAPAFRSKYREVDALLVDDVQFMAGKESTQEAFVHAFNTLHRRGQQVALSSNLPPQRIPSLDARLRSRFEWGLVVRLERPDLETRVAILRAKSVQHPAPVSDEVLLYLAGRLRGSVRELEGSLNRVVAFAGATNRRLDETLARDALAELGPEPVPPSLEAILRAVARFYELDLVDLQGPARTKAVARPRQVAMYLAREEAGASLAAIGSVLGGRDHSTVLHGDSRIRSSLSQDASLQHDLVRIRAMLYAPVP